MIKKRIIFLASLLISGFLVGPNYVLAAATPKAPVNISAIAGNKEAKVSFSPAPGDSGIYQYTIVSNPGNIQKSTTQPPFLFEGLTNGTSYTFTVRAFNFNGVGPFSAESSPVTPTDTAGALGAGPDAPVGVIAIPGDNQATVNFSPANGNTGIYQYEVVPNDGVADLKALSNTATSITVPNLVNGKTYTFKVRAYNLSGVGPFSAPSAPITINPATVVVGGSNKGYGPNAYGCSTDGENNTYCMLAPLPIVDKQGNIDPTGKLNVSTGVGDYIKGIIKLIMGLIGVFAVLMVVVGGIEYMSTIQVGEKEGAKNRIINALGGVVLALASYLILNTINPNLVNITVSAPQAVLELGEEGLESDDSTLVVPSDTQSNISVAVPSGSAQDLAKQILQNSNITLSPPWGSQDSKSSVRQNITDTANGAPAWTSPSRQGGQIQASLDSRMLAGLLAVANNVPSLNVTEILGGQHTTGSAHYKGLAFDIGGASFSYDVATAKKIMDICKAAGAKPRQIFGPCNGVGSGHSEFVACSATGYRTNSQHENHVHCGW